MPLSMFNISHSEFALTFDFKNKLLNYMAEIMTTATRHVCRHQQLTSSFVSRGSLYLNLSLSSWLVVFGVVPCSIRISVCREVIIGRGCVVFVHQVDLLFITHFLGYSSSFVRTGWLSPWEHS